ncbi:hypothetical protein ACFRAO_35980 [Streptomyces sp. NPDC056656]|uniref:hypothetical protein n=1 Tax=Streptomyces sp. NPDC056656 TaxID=3345895 RepID=UPI0036C51A92
MEEIRSLRSALCSGELDIEAVGLAFERLTFSLVNVTPEGERALAALVNEIELIRFSLLSENQVAAVSEVLIQAERLFESQGPLRS